MGGYGFWVVDISDPNNMKAVSHIDMPMSVSGTEGDNIDVTKVETTGMVYYSGYAAIQPGTPSQTVMPYAFYNAGVQVFDLKDPNKPTIGAYFVPKMSGEYLRNDGSGFEQSEHSNPVHSIFVEWDRNLIWAFSNHGIYVLSTPLLGEPVKGLPASKQ
ncbi:hypothetical protein ABE430_09375 [Brevibacillus agri]|uniref:hypothetical protein n=1 Tax=Brevibacillus agri TaxID=51101 RepID=UPI003D20BABA